MRSQVRSTMMNLPSRSEMNNIISLRQLKPADAPLLSKIGGISLIESHGHSAPMETMQDYVSRSFSEEACCNELSDDCNIFFLITYKDQPAGYSKIILNTSHPNVALQPATKLERLYLLREFYGLALGDHLLQRAIELATIAGDKGMWLNVWKKNDRAIHFYEKQGFQIMGESEFVLTSSHSNPNWVMWLTY